MKYNEITEMGGHITGGLAQAGQCFAEKIGAIFVRNFFVGMEWKSPLCQAAVTLAASGRQNGAESETGEPKTDYSRQKI